MRGLGPFLKDAWRLAVPYFRSEQRWSARGLLAVIIAMNLSLVGMSVILNFWNREFFNALQAKDWDAFVQLLLTYRHTESGVMPGFCGIVVIYIVIAIHRTWLTQLLQIRWRAWITGRFLEDWLADRAYYRISLTADHAGIGTDNPDQRIAEDLRDFVQITLVLSLDLLSNVVTLVSFLGILWSLSGPLHVLGVSIPGYMVWVAIAYAGLGTWVTHLIGRPLAALNFRQQRVEADFRYALVRLRENVEGVALLGGEQEEKHGLNHRFSGVVGNFRALMNKAKQLNAVIACYGQVADIFPLVVAAPRYFSGALPLGGLTQTASAFGRVQGALSWFIDVYSWSSTNHVNLPAWRATVERLATFQRALAAARAHAGDGVRVVTGDRRDVAFDDVTLALPSGAKLIQHADLHLAAGEMTVLSGRSGSGKSTLFRALAGIWPFGSGTISRPSGRVFFLPQRPYIPLGDLRHVVTYPEPPENFERAAIEQALRDAGLGRLISRLDMDENWALSLSGGEQQRLALARALLAKPDWLFLDEATASLDPEAEVSLYHILRKRLPHLTIVSIAHRESVARLHERHVVFERNVDAGAPGRLVESAPVA
jgi:putative ATP-binding cassette transporter